MRKEAQLNALLHIQVSGGYMVKNEWYQELFLTGACQAGDRHIMKSTASIWYQELSLTSACQAGDRHIMKSIASTLWAPPRLGERGPTTTCNYQMEQSQLASEGC